MRNAAFVLGIVGAIGDVDQHGRLFADHLVAVGHAGRDQESAKAVARRHTSVFLAPYVFDPRRRSTRTTCSRPAEGTQ